MSRPRPRLEEIPQDLPIVERDVVRLVVRDRDGRILLFHTREPTILELVAARGAVSRWNGVSRNRT